MWTVEKRELDGGAQEANGSKIEKEEEQRQYLKFDGGDIQYGDQTFGLRGQFLYTNLYRLEPLQDELVECLTSHLKLWTLKKFSGKTDHQSFYHKVLNSSFARDMSIFSILSFREIKLNDFAITTTTTNTNTTTTTKGKEEDGALKKETERLHTFNQDIFIAWVLDDFVDDPVAQSSPEFYDFVEFLGKITLDMTTSACQMTENDLRRRYLASGLDGKIELKDDIFPWLLLYHRNMVEMKQNYPWMSQSNLDVLGAARKRMYTYMTWLNHLNHTHVLKERLHLFLKRETTGYFAPVTLLATLLNVELDVEIVENRYVRRLGQLSADIGIFLNDVYSLQNDLRSGDIENVIILGLKRGVQPQAAIEAVCRQHDECAEEFVEIMEFMRQQNADNPTSMLTRYINVVHSFAAMLPQLHVNLDRYRGIKSVLKL